MITLITGLPGNGKSLYAITRTKERGEKEGRPVFFSGVADCMVPGWVECDPEKWMDLPKGSIVLIDEVQRVMRPRQHGTKPPPFIEALETHRHAGIDLVLVTQHPMLLDSNVRRLAGQHFHIVRKFGTHQAVAHEWGSVKETCDKNREDSIKHHWAFPKETFSLYKSAELHTHKRRIPPKVWLLLVLPLFLGALGWLLVTRLAAKGTPPPPAGAAGALSAPGALPPAPAGGPKLTVQEYLGQHVPRVEGLAYTAPIYDEVTKPVAAPYPAACISTATRCGCYSQQATVLQVPESLCRSIASGGFFVSWQQPAAQAVRLSAEKTPRESPERPLPGVAAIPWTKPTTMPAESLLDRDPTQPGGRGRNLPKPEPTPSRQ